MTKAEELYLLLKSMGAPVTYVKNDLTEYVYLDTELDLYSTPFFSWIHGEYNGFIARESVKVFKVKPKAGGVE